MDKDSSEVLQNSFQVLYQHWLLLNQAVEKKYELKKCLVNKSRFLIFCSLLPQDYEYQWIVSKDMFT